MSEEGVIFTRAATGRIAKAVRQVEGASGGAAGHRRQIVTPPAVRYGVPIAAVDHEAIAVLELDPCDVNGNDIADVRNVRVRVAWDGREVEMNLAADDVLPFVSFPLETESDQTRGLLLGGGDGSGVEYAVMTAASQAAMPARTAIFYLTTSDGTQIKDDVGVPLEVTLDLTADEISTHPIMMDYIPEGPFTVFKWLRYETAGVTDGIVVGLLRDIHGILDTTHDDIAEYHAPIQGDIIYSDADNSWRALARGTDDYILRMNGNVPNWEKLPAAEPHELLDGSVHPDTLNQDPVKGDVIIANADGKWSRLALDGIADNWVLAVDTASGLPTWQSPYHQLLDNDAHNDTDDMPPVEGYLVVGNSTPKWDTKVWTANGVLVSRAAAEDKIEWATAAADYQILQRKADDTIGFDYLRFGA